MSEQPTETPCSCPWCGSAWQRLSVQVVYAGLGAPRKHLECRDCGLRGPGGATDLEMVAAWNAIRCRRD